MKIPAIRIFRKPKLSVVLAALAVALVALRVLLPSICLHVLNRALESKLGTYTGRIEDFDLSLYRSAYQLQGLTIKKKNADLHPILSVEEIDLSLAWRALLRGEITANVWLIAPKVLLADSGDTEKKQFGNEEPVKNWQSAFEVVIPLKIESLAISKGSLSFTNNDLETPLSVKIDKLDLDAQNLRSRAPEVLSPFRLTAELQEHAPIEVNGEVAILSDPPKADMNFTLKDFRVNTVNKLWRTYLPLDFTKGLASLYGEAAMAHGNLVGYTKFFFQDGDIIAPEQEFISFKHFLLEILAGFGNWLLENSESERVAMIVPFRYVDGKLNVNSSKAFWSAVQNLGDALRTGINDSVSIKDVPRGK